MFLDDGTAHISQLPEVSRMTRCSNLHNVLGEVVKFSFSPAL